MKYRVSVGKATLEKLEEILRFVLKNKKHPYAKGDPEISKLAEHSITTGHRFKFEETKVIGKEPNWRHRKVHEAGEILKGGENVISTPSFEIDPIWRPLIKKTRIRKKWKNNNTQKPLRRSARIRQQVEREAPPTRSLRPRRGQCST